MVINVKIFNRLYIFMSFTIAGSRYTENVDQDQLDPDPHDC